MWGSGLDFDAAFNDAEMEADWYAGIKPIWGPLTFDFGIIYYTYPGEGFMLQPLVGPDLDYLEYKAGVSVSPFTNATLGATVYYSDDSFG